MRSTAPRTDRPSAIRAQRGVVAQYIHELSDRHAADRRAGERERRRERPSGPRPFRPGLIQAQVSLK
jgi:hypothetical protein